MELPAPSAASSSPYFLPSSSSISVRTAPTASAFTRTPSGVHVAAIEAVRLLTAAFDAPYGAPIGNGNRLEPDEMFTIAPLPRSIIGATANRERNHTLPRFRSTIWCHSSGVHAAIGLVVDPPALFTRMSSSPTASPVLATS